MQNGLPRYEQSFLHLEKRPIGQLLGKISMATVKTHSKRIVSQERVKVNEFAGLLNIFYIQGSTKINAIMTSQTITDEFIYVSVRGYERNT